MRGTEPGGHPRPRSPRRWIVYLALCLVVAALAVTQVWALNGRKGVVEDGRLYRSGALPADRLARFCAENGIRTVVDFRNTEADAREEAATLARLGVRSIHLPSTQVPPADTVAAFLQIMNETRGEPVLIHCRHGVGRAGVFAAIYRMEYQGWSPREAWLEAWAYAGFTSFLPGSSKTSFILSYRPRLAGDSLAAPGP